MNRHDYDSTNMSLLTRLVGIRFYPLGTDSVWIAMSCWLMIQQVNWIFCLLVRLQAQLWTLWEFLTDHLFQNIRNAVLDRSILKSSFTQKWKWAHGVKDFLLSDESIRRYLKYCPCSSKQNKNTSPCHSKAWKSKDMFLILLWLDSSERKKSYRTPRGWVNMDSFWFLAELALYQSVFTLQCSSSFSRFVSVTLSILQLLQQMQFTLPQTSQTRTWARLALEWSCWWQSGCYWWCCWWWSCSVPGKSPGPVAPFPYGTRSPCCSALCEEI